MGILLSYSIYSAIIMSLLYLTYKWVLAGENQHRANRAILLSIYAVSMGAYPLMAWIHSLAARSADTLSAATVDVEMPVLAGVDLHGNTIANTFLWIYLAGIAAVALHTAVIWIRLASIVAHGRHMAADRYTLVVTDRKEIAPFSWRKYIVMNEDDYAESGSIILCHETRHLALRHPIDLLVAQITVALGWWNPAAWLMREELKTVHEYQADSSVLAAGINARDYQMLLIKKAAGTRFPSLANSLNHSKLKKRITMMCTQKSSAKRRLRAIALLPALGAAVLVANLPAVASVMSEASSAQLFGTAGTDTPAPDSKVTKTSENAADTDEKVYDTAEVLPEFPGGITALLNFLKENLRYPAGHEDIQGRVVVQFVINKDGSVGDTKIMKSLSEPFDNEAVRVIKSLPNFSPGTINGKPVAVHYSLPLNFKKTGTAKKSTTQPGIEPTVVKINGKSGAAGTAELPANTIVKVNGEVIPTEQYKSIPSSSIASMNIDKRDDHAVINITTK